MGKEIELFQSVELKINDEINFIEPETTEFYERQGKYSVTFLFLEIKSTVPPTDMVFKVNYHTDNDNLYKRIEIPLIRYRKQFIFENGYYTLYLDGVSELMPELIPLKFKIMDKRNLDASVRLFFSINFLQR